ncbi:MAG: zinc ribbon domain-containing protein [Chloroflexi bacterium]|nr:zinc ribbon domain-containing protein [Chloroflexota bacterium]
MILSTLLIGIVLMAIVFPFVYKPLRRSTSASRLARSDSAHREAPTRVDLLIALRDLEFDYRTGKLSDSDYAALRTQLLSQIAELSTDATSDEVLNAEIEAAIQQRRQRLKKSTATCRECGAMLRSHDRFCPTCGAQISETRLCNRCGRPYRALDAFCAHCGASVPQMLEAVS